MSATAARAFDQRPPPLTTARSRSARNAALQSHETASPFDDAVTAARSIGRATISNEPRASTISGQTRHVRSSRSPRAHAELSDALVGPAPTLLKSNTHFVSLGKLH